MNHLPLLVATAVAALPASLQAAAHTIHVSPGGHAQADGTSQKPFATLESARDHLRTLKKAGPLPAGGATVLIADGIYPIPRPLKLTAVDSGTAASPVTYRARDGAEVIFDGSSVIPLNGMRPASSPAQLARLAPAARGKVVAIPVPDRTLARILGDTSATGRFLQQDNRLLTPARFPNVGFCHARDLLVEDEGTRWQDKPVRGTADTPNGATFTLRESPAGSWSQWQQEVRDRKKARVTGYISAQWYRETVPIASVDPSRGAIRLTPQTRYGLAEMVHKFQSRMCAKYLLCEIDSPGEWYFDDVERVLYLWPRGELTEQTRLVVGTGPGFLEIDGADHTVFRGLTVQGVSRASAVMSVNRGRHNVIGSCTIRNCQTTAFNLGGEHNTVTGCDVYDVAQLVRLSGGRASPDALVAGHNAVTNCHFFLDQLAGVAPTAGIRGVGNIFRNNLMHNLPGQAIVFRGNDHRIERNELFNIGFEEGDGAAIYSGAEFWGYGTLLRHNFLHHIMSTDGLMTRSGIMLDDHDSGREVIENIFYKTGHGSLAINGGTGLTVKRNIFLHGDFGVWVRIIGDVRGRMAMQAKFDAGELRRGDKHDYIWRCEQVVGKEGWNDEPWKSRYPTFAKVMNQTGEHGRFWPIENEVEGNLGHGMSHGLTYRHPMIREDRLVFKNTREIDPGAVFSDPEALDFTYKTAREDWMPAIPFREIGLYLDSYRKDMPDKAGYRKLVRAHFQNRRSCNRKAKYDFERVNETIYWNSGALLQQL